MNSIKVKTARIYNCLLSGGLTTTQIENRLGYSNTTINSYLKVLEKEGRIRHVVVNSKKKIWEIKNDTTN